MATVTLLEAYFGCGVILDWSDASGRDAAFRLALLTLADLEGTDPQSSTFATVDSGAGGNNLTFDATLDQLKTTVVPETRYCAATICEIGRSRYRFNVLSQDGAALEVGPDWKAPDDWFLNFWNTLWRISRRLQDTLPSFHLLIPGGEQGCATGHPLSPFTGRCEECHEAPAQSRSPNSA